MADSTPSSGSERVNGDHRETHGLRPDIDEQTSISDVKAPNVFERAKEEFEAIVEAIHPKKEQQRNQAESHVSFPNRHSAGKVESKEESTDLEKGKKSANLIEKAKEDIDALLHKKKHAPSHHTETHGTSNDIDESTPIDEVKGPNVFERVKEEVEAVLDAIHPKKDTQNAATPSPKKEGGGFRVSLGKGLEKMCSPRSHDKD